jgi:hypothetical protein
MNLQAYANHRKALGLRGTSHVAVLKAIERGRLMAPAVERQGRGWEINAELADQQWADTTHPAERGSGYHRGQDPAATAAEPEAEAQQQPASRPAKRQQDTAMPKGIPPRATSEAVIAAVKAQRETMALQQEQKKLAYIEDMEMAYNAVLLQLTTKAGSLHKQIKAAIPHLTHRELEKIERMIADVFESVAGSAFEELPE